MPGLVIDVVLALAAGAVVVLAALLLRYRMRSRAV